MLIKILTTVTLTLTLESAFRFQELSMQKRLCCPPVVGIGVSVSIGVNNGISIDIGVSTPKLIDPISIELHHLYIFFIF